MALEGTNESTLPQSGDFDQGACGSRSGAKTFVDGTRATRMLVPKWAMPDDSAPSPVPSRRQKKSI
jgi:hypothetical protein